MLTASCGLEPGRIVKYKPLLDEAIDLARHKPQACLVVQRPQSEASLRAGRDHDWAATMAAAKAAGRRAPCVELAAVDPLYILYTSGTTGIPKGVVRDNGGHMVALQWSMDNIYGVQPRRDVLDGLRHRLGGRPFLHRLRAAAARLRERAL